MKTEKKDLSWDAQEWLKRFENEKKLRDTHPSRIKVFESTLAIVNAGRYVSANGREIRLADFCNQDPLNSNIFCEREISLREPEHNHNTVVKVINQDCLECAKALLKKDSTDDVCVLNMASAKIPGGGVHWGAGAQEEYLFRCSDYFRFLYQYANPTDFDSEQVYGIPHNPRHQYPLKKDFGGVFSSGVTVFRDIEANGYALVNIPWQVNFVAVAACNIRGYHGNVPHWFDRSMLNRIRTILRIAYNNGQRRLVLGAFGCGAFVCPPERVASLFKQTLEEQEFQGIFREINFAIIEDNNSHGRNFNAFNAVLNYTQKCERAGADSCAAKTYKN